MSDQTRIEWSDATWSPVTGCDRVSPGCDHCYALTMAKRLKAMGSAKYQKDGDPRTSGPGFGVTIHPDMLELPLRWRKPRKIFVNSMSDLFHKDVPDEYIAKVFAVMALTPRHTFQVLTKRHGRMRSLLRDAHHNGFGRAIEDEMERHTTIGGIVQWPLPNVWLGVSVENQQWADIRIPALLDTSAAVRFLSCEPLLGPVDLREWISDDPVHFFHRKEDINWVIAGGESGRKGRRMETDWARSLRDQCVDAGVPYFFKQWGAWIPGGQLPDGKPPAAGEKFRLLDGRAWDEFPARAA